MKFSDYALTVNTLIALRDNFLDKEFCARDWKTYVAEHPDIPLFKSVDVNTIQAVAPLIREESFEREIETGGNWWIRFKANPEANWSWVGNYKTRKAFENGLKPHGFIILDSGCDTEPHKEAISMKRYWYKVNSEALIRHLDRIRDWAKSCAKKALAEYEKYSKLCVEIEEARQLL